MKKYTFTLIVVCCSYLPLFSQSPDRRAVYNASLDYIEAFYKTEPFRLEKSVYENMVRTGFYWKGRDSSYSDLKTMSYAQLVQFAKDWNKSQWLPADAVQKIEILDVQDKTAVSKITVYWGTEYLELAKIDDRWKIINILWQGYPKMANQNE